MPTTAPLTSPRLRRLVRHSVSAPETAATAEEQCELCSGSLPAGHRHLLDLERRELLCACRPCSLLFDREAAGTGHYRLVPERRLRLEDFILDDLLWERLRLPVDMAFFFDNSAAGRVVAFYPSPMGATESRLELAAWAALTQRNPVLSQLAPDVEALLVHRARDQRRYWLVPIDDAYRLVAVIRTHWRGFTGGREVWDALDGFFGELDRHARSHIQTLRGRD
jgi:hypothetical protein